MTDNLTNFDDTSDVSDAAIRWVLSKTQCNDWQTDAVRRDAKAGYPADQTRILAARLIQQHRPDLLADPVDAIVREEMRFDGFWPSGKFFETAKRLYLMGKEAGGK